jgi:uncharacterized protein (UPF0332 family)
MNPVQALYQKSLQSQQAAQILFTEKFYSFAVGRSYYAMFYMAEAALLSQDLSYSKHSSVIGAFNMVFVHQNPIFEAEMSRILVEGFDMRNTGDYDSYVEINKDQAIDLLAKSRIFCDRIVNYLEQIQKL